MRHKVHFKDIKEVQAFATRISDFGCDINLYDASRCLDAKSIVALMNLDLKKDFEVEIISNVESEIQLIEGVIRDYEKTD